MSKEQEYLTTEDVCERFHVSRVTVYRWKQAGLLSTGKKVGTRYLFTPQEIEELEEILTARDKELSKLHGEILNKARKGESLYVR